MHSTELESFFCRSAKPKVSTPTRPMNIKIIMDHFPRVVSVDVIPVLNPTVPKAEATSKRIWSNLNASEKLSKKVNRNIRLVYKMKVDVATNSLSNGIIRLRNEIRSWPTNRLFRIAIIATNVVIFSPPAVPDGEAPMYIKKVTSKRIGRLNSPIGNVLNPTVVIAVILWKKEDKNVALEVWVRGS